MLAVRQKHLAAGGRCDLGPRVLRRRGHRSQRAVVVASDDRRAQIDQAPVHGLDFRIPGNRLEHLVGVHAVRRVLPPEIQPIAALIDLDSGGLLEDLEQEGKELQTVEVVVLEMAHALCADPVEVGDEDSQSWIVPEVEPRVRIPVHQKDPEAPEQRLQEIALVCHASLLRRPRRIACLRRSVSGLARLTRLACGDTVLEKD